MKNQKISSKKEVIFTITSFLELVSGFEPLTY